MRVLLMSGYADSMSPFDPANPPRGFLGMPYHPSALAAKVRATLASPLTGDQPGTKEQAWP